jgi:Tfp pilus assembly PilM family ATPase
MTRLVALEWDGREARVAVGRKRGKDLLLDEAFAVDLGPREAGNTAADPQVGVRLAAALAARRIGRTEALVAVGRAGIELRLLSVPPAPDAELPDMVRFQAVRQFSALGENWPLDFVKLGAAEDGSANVLAAAISPDLVQQITTTCQTADVTPTHLVLRPFSAASLVVRKAPDDRCRLLVDLLTDEADLTVLDGSQVVFIRTVRLPAATESEGLARPLLGEIRRTMVAAQNQLHGKAVERIVLCGDSRDHAAHKSRLEQDLALPVDLFDPFSAVELSYELRTDRPEHSGRFAPLLGILSDEAAGIGHAIDFLHPRKRPKPPDQNRRNLAIGGLAAATLLLAVGLVWWQLRSLDAQIRQLTDVGKKQKTEVESAKKLETNAGEIDKWTDGDVPWLDELHRLSKQFPSGDEAVVTHLSTGVRKDGGGLMTIDGKVKESSLLARLEQKLRDPRYEIHGGGTDEDPQDKYPWRFKATIAIKTEAEVKQAAGKGAPAKRPAPAPRAAAPRTAPRSSP